MTPRRWWGGFALAASIAVVATIAGQRWSSCASLVSVQAVSWGSLQHHAAGDPLARQWVDIESGVAVVGFDSSALLQVTGPARFRPTGPNACHLEYGNVVALVPSAAGGFVVDTPTLRVTDLGTSFRVDATRDGKSTLQVLEGVVEVKSKHIGQSQRLLAGAAARSELGSPLAIVEPERVAPKTSNRIAYRTKLVTSLGKDGLKRNDRCFLFLERYNFRLPFELQVSIAKSGVHTRFDGSEASIARDVPVDCYMIHCAPFSGKNVIDGTIDFQGEILGVLASSDKLNASNDLLGSPWSLICQDHQRGLEGNSDPNADRVEISADRRSLRVQLRSEAIDQMRILVRTQAS